MLAELISGPALLQRCQQGQLSCFIQVRGGAGSPACGSWQGVGQDPPRVSQRHNQQRAGRGQLSHTTLARGGASPPTSMPPGPAPPHCPGEGRSISPAIKPSGLAHLCPCHHVQLYYDVQMKCGACSPKFCSWQGADLSLLLCGQLSCQQQVRCGEG